MGGLKRSEIIIILSIPTLELESEASVAIASDTIWTAKGDIAVATASATATVLAVGTNTQILSVSTDTPAWIDHFDATVPSTQAFGDTAAAGSAATAARRDHKHAMPTALATTSGLTLAATDKILGRSTTGAGAVEEIACTAAGRALLDDANAAAQRTTLGLGTMATATATDYVAKSTYDAYSILAADTDDTPQAITLAASEMIGRKATGGIVALAKADVLTILNVADGADVTGDNDPKAHATSHAVGGADTVFPAAPGSTQYLSCTALGVLAWAASSTAAHKDNHDPNDGSDALDTAAAAEISAVVAAGTGTSHSLARADHVHAINHAITDNHILTVDDAAAADNDFAIFTADGIEGVTSSAALTLLLANTLAENDSIKLDVALSADGTWNGITRAGTAGATLAFGDCVYFSAADNRWEKTDASAEATSKNLIGICVLAAANDGDATNVLLIGTVRADAAFPSFTVGAPVFLSEDAGVLTNTAPTTSASITRVVGQGITANDMWFCPDGHWYEHA